MRDLRSAGVTSRGQANREGVVVGAELEEAGAGGAGAGGEGVAFTRRL